MYLVAETESRDTAQLEFYIQTMGNLLTSCIAETCSYIDKKQTRTYEEIQKELEERDAEDDVPEDEDIEDSDLFSGGFVLRVAVCLSVVGLTR